MIRLSTVIQDKRVFRLRDKGMKFSTIAFKLSITLDQAKNAARRGRKVLENQNTPFYTLFRKQKLNT